MQLKFDKYRVEYAHQFNIYLCWLLAWSGSFKFQDNKEKLFLVVLAIDVLKKLVYRGEFTLPIEIFKVVMYSTFEYGDETMIKRLE